MSERFEVLDLVINTLRDHEKRLDDLVIRLELILDEISGKKSRKRQSSDSSFFSDDFDLSRYLLYKSRYDIRRKMK